MPETIFTTADADRLLGLADQFLEDWEQNEGKDDPECAQRRKEYDAIRRIFVAAPAMLAALNFACSVHDTYISEGFELLPDEKEAYDKMQAAIALAKEGDHVRHDR